MKDLRWSCRQEQIALIEWCLGFFCFIMGMLFDDHLYISTSIFEAVYIFKSLEIQFSICQLPKSACVIFFPRSYHMGVRSIWATRKNGTVDSFILFYVSCKWKGLVTVFVHSRSFTAACMGGKLAFSSFPPLWEENLQLQLYRRYYWR